MNPKILLFLSAILIGTACTKVEVEQSNPTPPKPTPTDTVKPPSVITDTNFLVVGNFGQLTRQSINVVLDLSNSQQLIDSSYVDIAIGTHVKAIRILVLKDSLYADGGFYLRTGVNFNVLDSAVKVGKICGSQYNAVPLNSTINFTTFCSDNYTTAENFLASTVLTGNVPLYMTAYHTTNAEFMMNEWKTPYNTDGYLCFRYLSGRDVKYGWIQMRINSSSQVEIMECVY